VHAWEHFFYLKRVGAPGEPCCSAASRLLGCLLGGSATSSSWVHLFCRTCCPLPPSRCCPPPPHSLLPASIVTLSSAHCPPHPPTCHAGPAHQPGGSGGGPHARAVRWVGAKRSRPPPSFRRMRAHCCSSGLAQRTHKRSTSRCGDQGQRHKSVSLCSGTCGGSCGEVKRVGLGLGLVLGLGLLG